MENKEGDSEVSRTYKCKGLNRILYNNMYGIKIQYKKLILYTDHVPEYITVLPYSHIPSLNKNCIHSG